MKGRTNWAPKSPELAKIASHMGMVERPASSMRRW